MVEIINTPINVSSPPTRKVCIGLYKENDFRQIQFDVTDWLEVYPSGTVSVIYQRADGEIYPVVLNSTSNPVAWKPLLADTCVVGDGRLEVVIKDESTNGKSILIPVCVLASIENADGSTETPDLVLQIIGSADTAKASADAAAASADAAAESADNSSASADAAAASANTASEYAEEAKATLMNVGECELGIEDLGNGVANVYHLSGPEYFRPSVLYTRQTLTDEQKAQARQNIGVQSIDDVVTSFNGATGDVNIDFVSSINGKTGDVDLDVSGASRVEFIFPKNTDADIRSGDCSLIRVDGKIVMIDCGRQSDVNGAVTGLQNITDMLDDFTISHIDYCIITNYRLEHCANFIELVNIGCIDSDTVIYLPPYSENFAQFGGFSDTIKNRHDSIMDKINEMGNVVVVEPTDDNGDDITTVKIGSSFKITFMNCDYEMFNTCTWTSYPEYSMCCLIEYGATKVFYSSDARGVVFDRLLSEGLIDGHVDLFKINFHGELLSLQNAHVYRRFINTICPDYAIQPSSMYDAARNLYNNSPVLKQLHDVGTHIYSVHNNDGYIVFSSDGNDVSVVSGVENAGVASCIDYSVNIYVDINTTNHIQDGSMSYPFRELGQAINYCNLSSSDCYNFYLADGTYNASDTDDNGLGDRLNLFKANINIYSISGNAEACIINSGGTYRYCNISFNDVTLIDTNNTTKATVDVLGGYVRLNRCIVSNHNEISRYVIYLHDHATGYLNDCIIDATRKDNGHIVMTTIGSAIKLQNVIFNNVKAGYYPMRVEKCSTYNYYCCKCDTPLIGAFDFSIKNIAMKITQQPQSINKTAGSRVYFTIEAEGANEYRWQYRETSDAGWKYGIPSGATGSGDRSQSLTITNIKNSLNGYQFRCLVYDKYDNSFASDAATLTVS